MTMKKALANATQLIFKDESDDASILGTMTGTELSSLPPCIVGRLRSVEGAPGRGEERLENGRERGGIGRRERTGKR